MGRGQESGAESGSTPLVRQRLDLFIWYARFLRSRSAAAELVRKGHVRVNALRVTQPGHSLRPGDVLTLALPGRTWLVRVESFAERRGPADAGFALYSRLDGAESAAGKSSS